MLAWTPIHNTCISLFDRCFCCKWHECMSHCTCTFRCITNRSAFTLSILHRAGIIRCTANQTVHLALLFWRLVYIQGNFRMHSLIWFVPYSSAARSVCRARRAGMYHAFCVHSSPKVHRRHWPFECDCRSDGTAFVSNENWVSTRITRKQHNGKTLFWGDLRWVARFGFKWAKSVQAESKHL